MAGPLTAACYSPRVADPVEILTSALIPAARFCHGWPTRAGGVSTEGRASLNLGGRWGDDPANVAENRRRVAIAAGFDAAQLVVTRHVHGIGVQVVGDPFAEPAEFDGLVCDRPGVTVAAFAADCLPVLLADPERGVCAAVHAGWRGTVAGAVTEALAAMVQRFGSLAADVRVAIGPSIGPCCFEVGPEVAEAFSRALPDTPGVVVAGPRKEHVDLRAATRALVERAGVQPEHVDDRPPCTRCDTARFFSYRRDGLAGGVHMGFIGLRA